MIQIYSDTVWFIVVVAWFCSHDVDMVSIVILTSSYGLKSWFCCGSKLWFLYVWGLVGFLGKCLETMSKHIRIISKQYQNHTNTNTISKSYRDHIKTMKTFEKSTKNLSNCCFWFLFPSKPTGAPRKVAPFPNHMSKPYNESYLKHSQTISKS